MVSFANILKMFAGVNNSAIDSLELTQDSKGVCALNVQLHPHKRHSCRCPICGRKGIVYDKAKKERCMESIGLRWNNH